MLRRFRFQVESGLAEESLDEIGPVLNAPEPAADDRGELVEGGGGEVAQAVLHVRPASLSRCAIVHEALDGRV